MRARRVDHRTAQIPKPTKRLIESVGRACYGGFAASLGLSLDLNLLDWDEIGSIQKQAWIDAARASFATISIAGGAEVHQID